MGRAPGYEIEPGGEPATSPTRRTPAPRLTSAGWASRATASSRNHQAGAPLAGHARREGTKTIMAATARDTRSVRTGDRTSCGFCEGGHGHPEGVCHDVHGRCKGTWPGFVPASVANPDGSWTCACSAAGHPGRASRAAW